ncbi:MAG: glycosyltransferase [Sulfitobacter sp.]|nr:glycosyltransferase [Sulfitobacter sp.]
MTIAYILNSYPQPSQSFIRREIRALEGAGHRVERIAMRAGDAPLVDAQDREEAAKTGYVLKGGARPLLGALWRALRTDGKAFGQALKAAWRMGRKSEAGPLRHLIYLSEAAEVKARCDRLGVSHCHAHFGTNAAAVAMLSHLLGGPRYSFTVHGPEEFDAPRALSLGDKIAQSAFTVAISSFGRSQLCRWADPADWPRIRIVHCGIETAKFADPTPLPEGPRHLVAIGRLVEQKGQLALIEAMARTKSDVSLTLIGDGELRGDIEARIAKAGLSGRVTLTGWVDEARIAQELARAHALVMPSFAEGLPMVVMEAMAAARPVIATYIAGTPELVQEGQTGWLIPAGDPVALSDAIDALAAAPLEQLQAMGDAGRARVLERHDVSKEAAKLAALIAQAGG